MTAALQWHGVQALSTELSAEKLGGDEIIHCGLISVKNLLIVLIGLTRALARLAGFMVGI